MNSSWPFVTSSPSLKLTDVSSPVICACTATIENASAMPIASTATGIGFSTTGAAVTVTAVSGGGAGESVRAGSAFPSAPHRAAATAAMIPKASVRTE